MKFQHAMQLKQMEIEGFLAEKEIKKTEKIKEQRNKRTQQSRMISQRKKDLPPQILRRESTASTRASMEKCLMGGKCQASPQDPMRDDGKMNQQNAL